MLTLMGKEDECFGLLSLGEQTVGGHRENNSLKRAIGEDI